MAQTVEQALSQAVFYSDSQPYAFVKLPPRAITAAAGVVAEIGEAFCAMLIDKDEVSLMIPQDAFEDFKQRLRDHQIAEERYRLITIDIELEPDLTGFMAHISHALAKAKVPIMPFAAFSRDHLFVPVPHFEAAMQVLNTLKQAALASH